MARVIIIEGLRKEILRKFQSESKNIFHRMLDLEKHPQRGKPLGVVEGIAIKELRYGTYRFYFLTDNHQLKFGTQDELASLIIKFIRMSKKSEQQKTIDEIKSIIEKLGF